MFLDRLDQSEQDSSGPPAQALPTLADLDALAAELDGIDATLAELQS